MKIRLPRLWASRPAPEPHNAERVPWREALAAMVQASRAEEHARAEARFGPASTWPRLSETLAGPQHPHKCQSCGTEQQASADEIVDVEKLFEGDQASIYAVSQLIDHQASPSPGVYAWQEHDDQDQPSSIAIMLCTDCSGRLIEPHPRLYRRLGRNEPFPGIMLPCIECAFRAGVRCTHPEARVNGGPGLQLDQDPPMSTHVRFGVGRGGACSTVYPNPVRSCSGRQPIPARDALR